MVAAQSRHRLFFALKPDEATLAAIGAVQARLGNDNGRVVPAERLHATLLFMGDQSRADLARLRELASGIDFPRCKVVLDRFGHFPRAAVGWLGPNRVPVELEAFQQRLSSAVAGEGISFDDKPWRMHLTLYRNLRKRPERIDIEPVEWPLKCFWLMESVQAKGRLRYLCRGRWPEREPD